MCPRRGRGTDCAPAALVWALLGGPSTSPLDVMQMCSAKPFKVRAFAWVTAAGLALCGCSGRDNLTVWKAEFPSPDQQWIAAADTIQNGGFGSASITTSVYLRRNGDPRPPVAVLELSCQGPMPHPYVLDNGADAGGSIHLSLNL